MNLREVFNNIIFNGLESIGKYYSSYRGYVVDNEDEDNLGRLQVKIPSVTHNKIHPVWAYPKNQWGGKDYGMQLLPLKGEIVWIEFEHGDPRFPIWNFAHRATGEKPIEFISSKIYGFKTPKGQLVLIDDRDGVEKIVIRSNKHIVIEGETVVLESDKLFIQGVITGTPRFSVGANGNFGSVDGRIVKVTNGLITDII